MDLTRIIGPGRAGRSLAVALERAGAPVELLPRDAPVADACRGAGLVLIATPDGEVARAARAIEPCADAVVAHVAGALGLDALAPHPRVASLHPLVALPDPGTGADRLHGAWFAVAGDDRVRTVVDRLDGRSVEVADADRVTYHAAAAIASNHVVALLGQVERVAARVGVPAEAYLDLVRGTLDNVAALGPRAALTGPVARGDWATVDRHLAALEPSERPAYAVLAEAADRLVRDGVSR